MTAPSNLVDPTARLSDETAEKMAGIVSAISRRYMAGDRRPWIVGFSGGKDSTLVAHLVFEAVKKVPPRLRNRPVFFISSDTRVETPPVVEFMRSQSAALGQGARDLALPFEAHVVEPTVLESFWVRLIGYGYPAPNRSFRWCTERLKIKPTNAFIMSKIDEYGEVLILLGSRYSESATRARSIRRHETQGEDLSPHSIVKNAFVWQPIKDVTTDEVWEYLAFRRPPPGAAIIDACRTCISRPTRASAQ